MSDRMGAHSASEPQCCGTPKFKQTNHLPHLGSSVKDLPCHQSKVREKISMKKKQVLGMLSHLGVPIISPLPECPSVHS